MGGVTNGRPVRNREQMKSRPELQSGRLVMPKLACGWLDLDSAEARRLQLWGESIIAEIVQFQHRQRRRLEGRQGVRA